MGLPNSPSFRYKALNPAYQSDPRRILGQQLMQQGSSSAPVATPLQGLGRLSSALVGAYLQKGAIDRQVARESEYEDKLTSALSGLNLSSTPILANFAQQFPEQALPIALSTEAKKATTKAPKQDFVTLTKTDGTSPITLPLGDARIGKLLSKGYIERQSGGTNVNVSIDKDANKLLVKEYGELSSAAKTANTALSSAYQLSDLLDEGLNTGFGSETGLQIQKIGQFFNPDYKIKDIAGKESFISTVNQLVLPRVKQLGRNPTDVDLKFVEAASPQLSSSVEGNRLIIETIKLTEMRKIRLFKYAADFIKKNRDLLKGDPLIGKIKLDEYLQKVTETDEILKPNGEATMALKTQLKNLLPNADIEKLQNKKSSAIDNLRNKGLIK